jgi:thiamine-phosphate pyrophosphorylase
MPNLGDTLGDIVTTPGGRPAGGGPICCVLVTALLGLATRLKTARLYVVTDSRPRTGDLSSFVGGTVAGGADVIQLSEPKLRPKAELAALGVLRKAAQPRQAIVAVSGDAELAGEFGADMLVLPDDDDSSASAARRRLHKWALIGRSCHTLADVDAALVDPDIDFLIVTADLSTVHHAADKAPQGDPASKPWFAAGGITVDYLDALIEAGCRRVVVARALARARDPRAAASEFAEALKKAWDADPAMEKVVLAAYGRTAPAASGSTGSGAEQADAPDAGDGFGSLTNPFKNASIPPAPTGGPLIPDPTAAS